MVFLGITALSQPSTFNAMPTGIGDIKETYIQNGIYDNLHISKNTSVFTNEELPNEWDENTILWAKYNGDMNAGNVFFTAENASGIKLKRKIKGTNDWLLLRQWKINNADDFSFKFDDKYNISNRDYVYAIIPVMGEIDGNISTQEVHSDFEGLFIANIDNIFGTYLDVQFQDISKNKASSVNNTLTSRYPFVVKNGSVNYYSGSLSALFAMLDKVGNIDESVNQLHYRENIIEMLQSNMPIIVKYEDGRGFLASVTTPPSTAFSYNENQPISFAFTEIGDVENNDDMKNNGMIEVDE